MRWVIGDKHKYYGKLCAMMTIEGEPYRFFNDKGSISMIPLDAQLLEEQ